MKDMLRIKLLSLLTLLAFFANAFIPFFAVYSVAQAQAAAFENPSDSRILICTATGFKWVNINDLDGNAPFHDQEDNSNHVNFECALCYVSAHMMKHCVASNDTGLTPPTLRLTHLAPSFTNLSFKDTKLISGYHSRAPPYFV